MTDGLDAWVVTLVELPEAQARLLMFSGRVPPRDTEMWVVDCTLDLRPEPMRLSDLPTVED